MNLLTQNSKLKKTSKELGLRVFNFGIPAYKSASGKLTCPMADSCVKFCYAKKGAYIWSNVKPAFEKRYQLTKTDNFVEAMNAEIRKKKPDYVLILAWNFAEPIMKMHKKYSEDIGDFILPMPYPKVINGK